MDQPPPQQRFPSTATTLIDALRGDSSADAERAAELLARAYWIPICTYLRFRWRASPRDAEDLTQAFFERVVGAGRLSGYEVGRVRLRTFIRRCLDNFVIDQQRRRNALKRGGGVQMVALDPAGPQKGAQHTLAAEPGIDEDPDMLFRREWLRRIIQLAREQLEAELTSKGKGEHLTVFAAVYDEDEPPSRAAIAAQLGIDVTTVNNRLGYARRAFRRIVVALLRQLTANDDEFAEELSALGQSTPDASD